MRPYADQIFPARHHSPLPPDRLAALPWLVAGELLISPFAARKGGLSAAETDAVEAMRLRLACDRSAGRLPTCTAFWLSPLDGRTTPVATDAAWLRARRAQYACAQLAGHANAA
jgi:hypothetical protein